MVTPWLFLAVAGAAADESAWHAECRVLVDRGALDEARACYEAAGASAVDDAGLALALAEVVGAARLRSQVLDDEAKAKAAPGIGDFDIGEFGFNGRGEVTVLGFVDGVVLGFVGVGLANSVGVNDAGALLLPVLGGLVGGGAAFGEMVFLGDRLSPGDVHVVRASLLLAPYEALTASLLLSTVGANATASFGTAAGIGLATVGVGAAVAAFTDVDEATPSLALSLAWVGGTSALLVLGAADLSREGVDRGETQLALVATSLGVYAGVVTGALLGPRLELTRSSVLLVDAGAAVGLLGGATLAYGLNAPNPALGYGAIATGLAAGAAAGVVGAVFVDDAIAAWWPAGAPNVAPSVVVGATGVAPAVAFTIALP